MSFRDRIRKRRTDAVELLCQYAVAAGRIGDEDVETIRSKLGEMNFFEFLRWFFSQYGAELFQLLLILLTL